MKSTLFINNITTVDHAVLMDNGAILGNSFNVGAFITGEVTEDEKVVEDFGTVKKRIKAFIDDKLDGFDHKLWVYGKSLGPSVEGMFTTIRGNGWRLTTPRDALKQIDFDPTHMSKSVVEEALEKYLTEKMPNLSFKIYTNVVPQTPFPVTKDRPVSLFRYTHGLKDSTSWGCQNIAHGHLSYLYLKENCDTCGPKAQRLQEEIVNTLNNVMFIKRENAYPSDSRDGIKIAYQSRDRGGFEYEFDQDVNQYILIDTETTIEFLAEFIADFWARDLRKCEVEKVFVSEGLVKGAVAEVRL